MKMRAKYSWLQEEDRAGDGLGRVPRKWRRRASFAPGTMLPKDEELGKLMGPQGLNAWSCNPPWCCSAGEGDSLLMACSF